MAEVRAQLDPRQAVVVSCVAWTAIGVVTGIIGSRLPREAVDHDTWITRLRPFEDHGRIYQRRLRINRWKDRLPEAGGLFGGASKRHVAGAGDDDLLAFANETRRAELVHWANLASGPAFLLWCPLPIGLTMVAFGVVAHAPFICIQRSNRGRIERILGARTAGRSAA